MDSGLLIVLLTASAAIVSCYEIYKSSCRRYSVFRITDRGQKVTWGFIKRINASSLSFCLKGCLDESVCKSFNFNKGANDNCELLSSTRKSGTTYADGWNHYEPIYQSTTPGCMAIGASSPCSPGYICKESCTGNGRFNCIDLATKGYMEELISNLERKLESKIAEKIELATKPLVNKIIILENKLSICEAHMRELEVQIDNAEQYTRRSWLRFYRIEAPDASKRESPADCMEAVKKVFIEMEVAIPEAEIDRTHHIGARKLVNDRIQQAIIVKFKSWKSRVAAYRVRKKLPKNTQRFVAATEQKQQHDLFDIVNGALGTRDMYSLQISWVAGFEIQDILESTRVGVGGNIYMAIERTLTVHGSSNPSLEVFEIISHTLNDLSNQDADAGNDSDNNQNTELI
eukprot:gene14812-5920_t